MLDQDAIMGKYRIIRRIGQGGMSVVYLAVQESLHRNVALKVMSPALLALDKNFGDRFLKEGRTVAQLRHQGIVRVYDIGVSEDSLFMAMAYIPGGDLAERISRGMPESEALNVLRQLADALGYAHGKGFVHRDIKPENVLFDDEGRAVLTDFGISKAMRSGTKMTRAGMSIGTPRYMSPEQARGQVVDGRADLYSLGVLLHEMLTGSVPYDEEDTYAIGLMHINAPLPTLSSAHSKYQPLVERLMAKNPTDRFTDAEELLQGVDALASGGYIDVPKPPSLEYLRPSPEVTVQRHGQGTRLAFGGAFMALMIFGLAYLYLAREVESNFPAGPVTVFENQSTLPGGPSTLDEQNGPHVTLQNGPVKGYVEAPDHVEKGTAPVTPSPDLSGALLVQTEGQPVVAPDTEQKVFSPEQTRQSEIQELLRAAGEDIQARRLTLPVGSNAFEKYQRVLELDSYNANAHQGLKYIVQGYIFLAEQAIASTKFSDAANHLNLADTVLPGEEAVSAQRERLAQAQEEYEQEQARLLEMEERRQDKETELIEEARLAEETPWADARKQAEAVLLAEDDRLAEDRRIEEEAPRQSRLGEEWIEPRTGMEFVWVPKGCFQMGCGSWTDQCYDDEKPVHEVCLDGFWMGRYEVTQAQWEKVMGSNPSHFKGPNNPVEQVSWHDVQEYIRKLDSQSSASGFRLPTEAQREYACLSGGRQEKYCGGNNVDIVGWHSGNSDGRTHPVGGKAPNALGIHDMSGNVWEWVSDVWDERAYSHSGRQNNPEVSGGGARRVFRGGSWDSEPRSLRSSNRFRHTPGYRDFNLGFRILRENAD